MTCQRAQLVILFGNNDIFNNRFNNVTGIIGFSSKPQPARFLEIYIHTYIRVRPCVRIPFPLVRVHQLSPLVLIYTSCFILYTWILVLVNVCTCAIYVLYARRKCGRNLVWSFNCDILLRIFLISLNRVVLLRIMRIYRAICTTHCTRLTQG